MPDAAEDEILHAAIARTVKQRWKDTGTGKCRVSGVPDQKSAETGKQFEKTTNKKELARK